MTRVERLSTAGMAAALACSGDVDVFESVSFAACQTRGCGLADAATIREILQNDMRCTKCHTPAINIERLVHCIITAETKGVNHTYDTVAYGTDVECGGDTGSECCVPYCGNTGPVILMCSNGHAMHAKCIIDMISKADVHTEYRCPMCRDKTIQLLHCAHTILIHIMTKNGINGPIFGMGVRMT